MIRIRPGPEVVEHYRQLLDDRPEDIRGGFVLGYLAASVREAADDHEQRCDECTTCDYLRQMLALILAYELNEAPPDALRRIHRMDANSE